MPLIDRAKPVDIDRMRAEGQIPLSPARISEDISKVREKMEQLVPLFEETAQLQKDSSALVEKLLDLNTTLKALGFEDCLYIDKNKKKERYCLQGDWCWVCPSAIKYWKWEWDELPSASGG